MKESFKQILLNNGTISFPWKESMEHYYGKITIGKIKPTWGNKKEYYFVEPFFEKFNDIDEALDYFISKTFSSKNKGLIQTRLQSKGIDFEKDYNLEKPNKELKKLFSDEGKLIMKEYKEIFG